MRYLGQRKGAVLIIVLGVLAVLALLAVTFSTLQATERQIAHNYMDTVRAKLLAQSGIQDAEAKLREYFPGRYFNTLNVKAPKPWKYWGQDPTEMIEPPVDDKIEYCINPSFAIEADPQKNVVENPQDPTDSNVNPKKVSIEGKMCGLSGYQGGTYATHGDQYVLRVTDTSGRLYVNDGVDGTPNGKTNSVSRNMRRILNILGEVIQTMKLGDKIIDGRPPEGYRSLQDVLKALNYDEALFNKIKNYITVYAWVDNNVVNPVPLNQNVAQTVMTARTGVSYNRGSNNIYRAGSEVQGLDSEGKELNYGLDYMQNSTDVSRREVRVFGLDALNPQHIEVVSRAPVNVNAASEEVITALLTGLQGFFLTDRKRNNPRWEGDLYLAFKMQFKFYPETTSKGDEIGFLVDTFPIVNATGTGTPGISARVLAHEIVACRNGDKGRYANYNPKTGGGKWFGGPFRTWHQFNSFIDYLARSTADGGAGFLEDKRSDIFKDYEEEGVDPIGFGGLVTSDLQREYASQAIADVIKANFNPNCHLNELNPDANLFLIVDKTDLFVNSTEFCFMPTGYFEVESLGRVLRPRSPKETDAYLGDNEIAAQAKVTATLKLFEMYRESTQKQFYGGTLAPQSSQWGTNNDKSIEIGPEPDNGYFPGNLNNAAREQADNEWDGYLALPTMGGVYGGGHGAAPKQPNTLARTMGLGKSPHLGAAFHTHFTLDMDAHDAPGDPSEIGCKKPVAGTSETYNFGDYVKGSGILPYGGPYNPTKGQPGYHRLAKSFRLEPDKKTGTLPMRTLEPFAPSDLRIDGAYVERHSAPVYYNLLNGVGIWDFTSRQPHQGMISFWWKPSYSPERTGKIRTLWDMSRSHDSCGASVNVWPFALWFYPAQYNPGTSEVTNPQYWHNNMGKFNPASLCGGSKQWHGSSSGNPDPAHEFGRMTVCLNHLGHQDHKWTQASPLQAHRWMNTTFMWDLTVGDDHSAEKTCKIYINGTESYTKYNYTQMTNFTSGHARISMFEKHDGGAWNHMRLGGSSMLCKAATGLADENHAYRGNYTGDHTIDEFYAWNKGGDPLILWQGSRYYRPTGSGSTGGGQTSQGRFTSQALTTMVPYAQRLLAPPSNTPAPGGVMAVAGGTQTAEPPTLRVLGMCWTWYGELPDHRLSPWASWDGTRQLYDYNGAGAGEAGMPVRNLDVKVGAGIDDGGQIYGPFYDDGFSAILNSRSRTPSVQDPTKLKYFAQIEVPGGGKPILLATPVIDDITLFWDDNQSHLLSYVFDNRSF